ncbi:NAD(+) diphosphatase [Fulvimarina endophytica]|uniref:NAD(+) diphosphatase n=1 Tax=Fulvimarina endophytica TaxID=2293836 RepID=A0A371X1C3_9HYPH|nr:NAD(+) diphosphatase [Fulvimarina endophytica]RFC63040.1 NAD(+) diphosphatase [Fulvimarina endophytica]
MTSLFKTPTEASTPPLGFATNSLDRESETRGPETLAQALADPNAIVFVRAATGFLCAVTGDAPQPGFSMEEATRFADLANPDTVLLGHDGEKRPVIAVGALPDLDPPDHIKIIDLRSLAAQGNLEPETEGRLAQAQHLLLWHGSNHFCAQCGGETVSEAAGASRRCTRCGDIVFPRINPVSIMLIHDGAGRCILGRQPHFPEKSWSCLAGFVEAGETLEAAVRRETREEAGVEIASVHYLCSQPWPFAGNLMLGLVALAATTEIRFDSNELEACRWFGRDEVKAMIEGRHADGLVVPPPLAIAHHLIRAFVADEI